MLRHLKKNTQTQTALFWCVNSFVKHLFTSHAPRGTKPLTEGTSIFLLMPLKQQHFAIFALKVETMRDYVFFCKENLTSYSSVASRFDLVRMIGPQTRTFLYSCLKFACFSMRFGCLSVKFIKLCLLLTLSTAQTHQKSLGSD